jgi:hypothetical protein
MHVDTIRCTLTGRMQAFRAWHVVGMQALHCLKVRAGMHACSPNSRPHATTWFLKQPTKQHTHLSMTRIYLSSFQGPSRSRHLSFLKRHQPCMHALLPFMHFTCLLIFRVRTLCNVSGLSTIHACMCDVSWAPTHSTSSFASLPPQQKFSKEKSRLHHVWRKVSLHHVFTPVAVVVHPIPTYMYIC